jgi:3-hydroxyisobutyrate dehydrogenase-like beta-hydroxyacid dehydrogenase
MLVAGILSPGAMGSAIGASLRSGGVRAVTTVAGRSARSAQFARDAGFELVADVDALVRVSDVILSVVPPESALKVADLLASSCSRVGRRPLVAELNAVSPDTVTKIAEFLDVIDGAISGPPPKPDSSTMIYLSGPDVSVLSSVDAPGIRWIPVGDTIGAASAVKMCTASVYKGMSALLAHALLTAEQHGVTSHVLADVRQLTSEALRQPIQAATKAWRFVGEMEQIAATQAAAGLTPALFEAVGEVYRELSTSAWGSRNPEDVPKDLDTSALLDLRPRT